MDREMRSDAELLNCLCDEAPVITFASGGVASLSKKLIAQWTGRSVQTVSDYATGKLNIPIDFWSRILVHFHEPRIVALLLGDSLYEYTRLPADAQPTGRQFFKDAVTESGAHHEKMKHIAGILEDGHINELDARRVQEYHDSYIQHRYRSAVLHHQVMHAFQRSRAEKVRSL